MATDLFFRQLVPALWGNPGGSAHAFNLKDAGRTVQPGASVFRGTSNTIRVLSPTIGSGAGASIGTTTVTGTTAGLMVASETDPTPFVTDPLAADVTISSTVNFALCGLESSMNANATFRVALYRLDAEGALTLIIDSSFGTELGTANGRKSWSGSPTSTDCKKGDRLFALVLVDDATSLTMGSGFTVTLNYDGSNANTADSKITLTENLTFLSSDPGGSTYYLRNTASDISGAKALSTTQGSGTEVATHTTLTGPLTFPGDQWTLTAGGSDAEWFFPAFDAFTLSEVVQVILQNDGTLLETSTSPRDSFIVELAVCDSDGSNPVIWARSYTSYLGTAWSAHYLSGADLSVAAGKRLRLRFFSDDWLNDVGSQVSGTNRNFRYDGTSTYAARIILTQTVTEAVAALSPPPFGARYRPQFNAPRRRYK